MFNPKNLTKDSLRGSALWLYRLATSRQRSNRLKHLQTERNCPVAILFYHRVADEYQDDLTIGSANFASHLDWLQDHFDIVTLAEAQLRIRSSYNDRPAVSITFDDGYQSNARTAIPELLQRGIPATYFVSSDFIHSGYPFPHDVKYGNSLRPNTVQELRDFVAAGITLGGHTRSHCDLGSISCPVKMRDEIIGGARQLAEWCDTEIRYFSFPFGLPANTNQLAVDVIREAGFDGFCTAYGAWNWPNSNGFHLRRIHGDAGIERIKNWLTLDPRKLFDDQELPFVEKNLPSQTVMSDALA